MPQSATPTIPFASTAPLPIEARFDAGHLTSDGGLPWLAEADDVLGLCAALAAEVPDWRRRPGQHSLVTLVRQRAFQIACGYEDQDDADSLRTDPLLKLVCGRLPSGADLASQPTLSRLENAVDRKACYRLAQALLALYVRERGRQGPPERILLDADSTDDPTHGEQEGSAYHGYYRQHQYHPLLLFDGDTDQLIGAILRPGTAHASRGIVAGRGVHEPLRLRPARCGRPHLHRQRDRSRGERLGAGFRRLDDRRRPARGLANGPRGERRPDLGHNPPGGLPADRRAATERPAGGAGRSIVR